MVKKCMKQIDNESGSILLITLMVLMALTLIGIFATQTTTVEIEIAGNDKFHKEAFYDADSGVYTVPKVISRSIDDHAAPAAAAEILYPGTLTAADFYSNLITKAAVTTVFTPNIQIVLAGDTTKLVEVAVQRVGAFNLAGGGAEFAAAVDGASTGMQGIVYELDSVGTGSRSSQSNVGANYIKVIGVAGGM